ncbi:MAG: MFS transporter [Burkholderiaceae bacterium]
MSSSNQFALLKQRRFAPFFWTQFAGAANDNIFKVAFTALVTYQAAMFEGVDTKSAAFVISAIFILPFVLFSATSGQISDKFDKARVMRLVKSLEIVIMVIGGAGFLLHNIWLLYAGTFLMGLHSTLFGPVKYAYLPQQLNERELVGGNGMIEMGTFVAILVGTIVGGELADLGVLGPVVVAAVCLGVAVAGRIVVSFVPASPSDQPDLTINWNPFTETWRNLKLAREQRAVFLSLLGISWLWFFGATFLTSFFNFAKDVLGGDPQVVTLLLATFSIGIGTGSLLCERLSRGKVEIGLVPFGSIGMTVFAVDLYFASHGLQSARVADASLVGAGAFLTDAAHRVAHWRVMIDLFLLSMFGGLYSVPLYAMIQSRSKPTHRARIIAANNILNSMFMIVSSLMAITLFSFGFTIPQLFLITGLLNAVVAIYIYTLVPEFLVRFVSWILVSTFYRIRTTGIEHLPEEGAALLVCNHVSFVDAIVIMGESPRPIRFVMDYGIFKQPLLASFFRASGAIGIVSAKKDERAFTKANALIDEALADGDLVCIFPEGRITDTGEIYPFKEGAVRIAERNRVPVIPMALRGLWGSWSSRESGSAFASLPRPIKRRASSRLELAVGLPMNSEALTPETLQSRVAMLRGDMK